MKSSKKEWTETEIEKLVTLRLSGETWNDIADNMEGVTPNSARKAFYRYTRDGVVSNSERRIPKVLIFDIETAPIEAYVWDIWNVNISLNQIIKDWSVLSFSAKWLHDSPDKVFYYDTRNELDPRDDKKLLEIIWSLLDEAEIVITQNGDKFDIPKLRARFLLNGMKPFSSVKSIDTYKILKKFGLTSKKLAFTTDRLCTKYKKLSHGKFPGQDLWTECLNGNIEAWKEMEEYNKHDVLSLEELYVDHLMKWDDTLNFASFTEELKFRCNCGCDTFTQKGFVRTKKSKFERFICDNCGKEHRNSKNLFNKEQRAELKV